MLRVAHLLPNMVAGGRETLVAEYCGVANDYGVTPSIICYDPNASGRAIATPNIAQCAVDRVAPDFANRLAAQLHADGIDVLHCQGHVAAALAWPVMRAIPTVTTVHVALGGGWRWLPHIILGLRRSRAVTAVSADLARRFRPLSNKPISVIAPGINLDRFGSGQRPQAPGVFTIGVAARLHPVKRHCDLISALRILKDNGHRCRLLIAGEGPEEQALRAQAADLDIRFDGHVADMPGWLGTLDAFILPSAHEGTPLALIEAMACGVPCVATGVGGIPDLAGDAVQLVRPRDPNGLALAISALINDESARSQLSQAARQRAETFSIQRFSEMSSALYESTR